MTNGPPTVEVLNSKIEALQREIVSRHESLIRHIDELDKKRTEMQAIHDSAHIAAHRADDSAREATRLEDIRHQARSDAATDRRWEGANEFRGQLSDQAATYVTKDMLDGLGREIKARLDSLDARIGTFSTAESYKLNANRISSIELWQATINGQKTAAAFIIPILMAVIAVGVDLFLK